MSDKVKATVLGAGAFLASVAVFGLAMPAVPSGAGIFHDVSAELPYLAMMALPLALIPVPT